MNLKKGDRFFHKVWLYPDFANRPLKCLVTRIANGCIYYRPDYGVHDDGTPWLGSATYFTVDQIPRYVGEIIE